MIESNITNYRYVGGSYGKSNEFYMMEELYNNGPIVVSFEPDEGFSVYKDGIYTKANLKNWFTLGEIKPEWYKVDHSGTCFYKVLLIGWGREI
jgi:cathepsin C